MDIFSDLQECSLNGIGFPVSSITTNFVQDTTSHKILGKDGAYVEPTGKEPIGFELAAIFSDTITTGALDTWKQGTLFSKVRPQILKLYVEQSKQNIPVKFEHPYLGSFKVFVTKMTDSLDAEYRGGVKTSISLVQHTELDEKVEELDGFKLAGLMSYWEAMNSIVENVNPAVFPEPKKYCASLRDSIRSVQAIADRLEYLSKSGDRAYDSLKSNCDNLIDSVKRINSYTLAPVIRDASKIRIIAMKSEKILISSGKPTKDIVVSDDITMLMLAKKLKQKPEDIVRLNPKLIKKRFIVKGTSVKYYG